MCDYGDTVAISFRVNRLHVFLQFTRNYKNTDKKTTTKFCITYLINVQAVQAKCFARVYIL